MYIRIIGSIGIEKWESAVLGLSLVGHRSAIQVKNCLKFSEKTVYGFVASVGII